MKRLLRYLFSPAFLFAGLLSASCSGPKDGSYDITLISTNDVHGKYFDSLYVGGKANRTSYSNVSTLVNSLRANGADPVLVDVGDNLQGDVAAYYYNFVDTSSVHVAAEIMNYIGYDAVVVGNHDVETGHPVYDRVRSELKMPYLAADAVKTDGSEKPYFDDYTIVERKGVKIAVIGLTNPNIPKWISEDLYSGMRFDSIPATARRLVDFVKAKEKPQLVVVAMHSGTGGGLPGDFEDVGLLCARTLQGVDAVLCAHDHLPYSTLVTREDGSEVLLVDAGKNARYAGCVKFDITVKGGKVVSKRIAGSTVDLEGVPSDTSYNRRFRPSYEKVKAYTNRVIGVLDNDIVCGDALEGPSSYISLVQSAVFEKTGADISICAPLTFNATVKAGQIDIQDLFTLYPYENGLYVLKMKGAQVRGMLEMSYDLQVSGKGPKFNYDSAEGIDYEVSRSAPDGGKVKILSMSDGTPFCEDSTYRVALTSYRASGGDFMEKGAGISGKGVDTLIVARYPSIRDILYEYIAGNMEIKAEPKYNWKFVN